LVDSVSLRKKSAQRPEIIGNREARSMGRRYGNVSKIGNVRARKVPRVLAS
jgi:hypothetical protein